MDLRRILLLLTVGIAAVVQGADFGRDILPVLSGKCFECHGPDENARKAGLRLDTAAGSREVIKSGELLKRIHSGDPDEAMPPPESKFSLTPAEKKIVREWINAGSAYQQHWAFIAPKKSPARSLDAVVDARLQAEGLKRSPRAKAETLCRRLYLDLTGLPPSPKDVDAFVNHARKNWKQAVEELTNRLLKAEAYAEKWARHWLDVARYADSNGFEKDMPREQWAWRDWVIRSLARDQPYDQFVIEQIAGDLIPNRTQEQLVATGFLRNGMVNEEGAIIYEQFRLEGIFDRMDCIGKGVLGLTLQCAQCHTHKFDPITHDEYYGMFAFLNDTYEAQSWVYTQAQQDKITSIKKQVAAIEDQIRRETPDWKKQLNAWKERERLREQQWEDLDAIEHIWEGGLNHPEKLADKSIIVLGHPSTRGKMYVTAKPRTTTLSAVRIEALRYGDLPFGGPGRSYRGLFAISEVEVFTRPPKSQAWTKMNLTHAEADFEEKTHPIEKFFWNHRAEAKSDDRTIGAAKLAIDGNGKTAWRPDRGPVLRHTDSVLLVRPGSPVKLAPNIEIKVRITVDHGGDGGVDNQQLGRFRVGITGVKSPKLAPHDHAHTIGVRKGRASFRAWRKTVAKLKPLNDKIARLEQGFPEASTSVLHLAEPIASERRATHLLDRGAWNKPQHSVKPHTPALLPALTKGNASRLDFARWLVERDNPLSARVEVNRTWQAIFGTGLVETAEDFGTRAKRPEHLDLLDWLSVDFMEHNWSRKHLIRRIVSSQTYQQSSKTTALLLEKDPRNHLLARGPRFRAEAEVVRDIALSASGLLHAKIGGASFFPPVPQSLLDYNFFKPYYWEAAEAPERHRRSLYMFRKRAMPDPVMSSFDAPNSDFACARRVRSNTPLAALVSLNEPIFVEAAKAMALRIVREGGHGDEAWIDYGYRLTTGRSVKAAEREELLRFLKGQRKRLANGWINMFRLGFQDPEDIPELPKGVSPQDVAAWTIASRVLLNLDETLTKN
ncbi:MAG: hypothetical protein CMO80_11200 [Verrucomicrobiales bacterium]|nr:hypothetical protein [Verrucomicrobiales bacterium]|tara:strand:+ start:1340 stop:4354 length:3015 start_codon:yes stop_codon:yes gene_type:complete